LSLLADSPDALVLQRGALYYLRLVIPPFSANNNFILFSIVLAPNGSLYPGVAALVVPLRLGLTVAVFLGDRYRRLSQPLNHPFSRSFDLVDISVLSQGSQVF
jgi:hypothetical protein